MATGGVRINPNKFSKNQIPIYIYIIPIAVFMGLPIVYIIAHSLKPMNELFAFPPRFFPLRPTLDNFRSLMQVSSTSSIPLSRYLFNSAVVTLVVVFLASFLSTMAGFALSKLKFRLKNPIMEINNAALMFVPVAVTIPRYLTIANMGILDTYWAHILPLVAMPVGLFLVKQFIDQVPDALLEAAQIEGANAFTVYRKVVLPLIKPAIATVAILTFQQVWNNIETSNLFTDSESIRTVAFFMNTFTPLGTAGATGQVSSASSVQGQGLAAAASVIMFLPNLILFVIMQSNVMNTMAHSGLK